MKKTTFIGIFRYKGNLLHSASSDRKNYPDSASPANDLKKSELVCRMANTPIKTKTGSPHTRINSHRAIIAILLFISSVFQIKTAADDYIDNWTYHNDCILNTKADGADVSENVVNFPALIRLNSSNFSFSQAKSNGEDIRFAKYNGTPLSYEIERWDTAKELAEIWVLIDTVYGNNGTQHINMYWGNPDAADRSDGTAVFNTSNGFAGVWHLGENKGPSRDATGNSNNGTKDLGDAQDGIVGQSQALDGTEFDSIPNHKSIQLGAADFTLSAWARTNNSNYRSTIVCKGAGWDGGKRTVLRFRADSSIDVTLDDNSDVRGVVSAGNNYLDDNWHLVYGIRDGKVLRLYIDGVEEAGTGDLSQMGSLDIENRGLTIGMMINNFDNSSNEFFNGNIDEVRLSKTARSTEWIQLSYENQRANQRLVHIDKGKANSLPVIGSQLFQNPPFLQILQTMPGHQHVKAQFRVKDNESDSAEIINFEYSPDSGITWYSVPDTSPALERSWSSNLVPSAPDFAQAKDYSILFKTDMAAGDILKGRDLSGVKLRLTVAEPSQKKSVTAVSKPFRVDNKSPIIVFEAVVTPNPSPSLSGSSDEKVSRVEIEINNNSYFPEISEDSLHWTLAGNTLPQLNPGTYTVFINARDQVDNSAEKSVESGLTINPGPIIVSVNRLTTAERSPAISGTVSDAEAEVSISIGEETFPASISPDGKWRIPSGTFQKMSPGTYDVKVSANSAYGALGQDTTTGELVILDTGLVVTINDVYVNNNSPEFNGTVGMDDALVTLEILSPREGSFQVIESLPAVNTGDGNWRLESGRLNPLPEGILAAVVTAAVPGGTPGTDTALVTIDLSPPHTISQAPEHGTLTKSVEYITLVFSETVFKNKGAIHLKKTDDNSLVKSFDVSSDENLHIENSAIRLRLSGKLQDNTTYYVVIDSAAFMDRAGNCFGGFTDRTSWSFRVDTLPPVIQSFTPVSHSKIASPEVNWSQNEDLQSATLSWLNCKTQKGECEGKDTVLVGELLKAGSQRVFIPIEALTDGASYTVKLTLTDSAGNTAETANDQVTIYSGVEAFILAPGDTSVAVGSNWTFRGIGKGNPENGKEVILDSVVWRTRGGQCAVKENGEFQALGLGHCRITGQYRDLESTVTVIVNEAVVSIAGKESSCITLDAGIQIDLPENLKTQDTVFHIRTLDTSNYPTGMLPIGAAFLFESNAQKKNWTFAEPVLLRLKVFDSSLDDSALKKAAIYKTLPQQKGGWTWLPSVLKDGWIETVTDTLGSYIAAVDTLPPRLNSLSLKSSSIAGVGIDVSAEIWDNIANPTAYIHVHMGGGESSLIPMHKGDLLNRGTILGSWSSKLGLWYTIKASDGAHTISSDTVDVRVEISEPLTPGDALQLKEGAYQMFSIPLQPEQNTVSRMLNDDFGEFNKKRWRLYTYEKEFTELKKDDEILPGRAYWIRTRDFTPNIDVDEVKINTLPVSRPFALPLNAGWNCIANPFSFPLSPADLRTSEGGEVDQLWERSGGNWLSKTNITSVAPWRGYLIWNGSEKISDSLFIYPWTHSAKTGKFAASRHAVRISLSVSDGYFQDGLAVLGFGAKDAQNGPDKWDCVKPGIFSEPLELSLQVGWDKKTPYLTDIRKALGNGQSWNFSLRLGKEAAEPTLSFTGLATLPTGVRAVLLDRTSGQSLPLSGKPLPYPGGRQKSVNTFEVAVGNNEYLNKRRAQFKLETSKFRLNRVSPNPFSSRTVIHYALPWNQNRPMAVRLRIIDTKGRIVRTLVDESQTPGRHSIVWALAAHGPPIRSGSYFCLLTAGNQRAVKKLVVLQ